MEMIKMHGLGNDFILIDNRDGKVADPAALAQKLCNRRLSVGADGLLLIENSEVADMRMRVINSDGSEAEMCGNGIRCFARYLHDHIYKGTTAFSVETLAGIMKPTLEVANGEVTGVKVDMGAPSFERESIPMQGSGSPLGQKVLVGAREITLNCVLMGVPHAVVICARLADVDFDYLGPALETHPIFPKKSNIDFVEIENRHKIHMKTWERGAGATMACGTGACASAVVLHWLGLAESSVEVCLEAGSLFIEVAQQTVYMTGPAEYVFRGELL